MFTTLSSKGQTVIPEAIREQACLRAGDKLDVGCLNGLVVLRKRAPLSNAEVRSLIRSGNTLPEFDAAAVQEVAGAVAEVRRRRKAGR